MNRISHYLSAVSVVLAFLSPSVFGEGHTSAPPACPSSIAPIHLPAGKYNNVNLASHYVLESNPQISFFASTFFSALAASGLEVKLASRKRASVQVKIDKIYLDPTGDLVVNYSKAGQTFSEFEDLIDFVEIPTAISGPGYVPLSGSSPASTARVSPGQAVLKIKPGSLHLATISASWLDPSKITMTQTTGAKSPTEVCSEIRYSDFSYTFVACYQKTSKAITELRFDSASDLQGFKDYLGSILDKYLD